MPDPGHQAAATTPNNMRDANFGFNKIIMPSQSGRTPNNCKQSPEIQAYLQGGVAGGPPMTTTQKKKV